MKVTSITIENLTNFSDRLNAIEHDYLLTINLDIAEPLQIPMKSELNVFSMEFQQQCLVAVANFAAHKVYGQ